MSDCKMYPADTVDATGTVWPTIGENIRNGIYQEEVKEGSIIIRNGVVSSDDVVISNISDYGFRVNKKILFFIVKKVYRGQAGIRLTYFSNYTDIITTSKVPYFDADISIIYGDCYDN